MVIVLNAGAAKVEKQISQGARIELAFSDLYSDSESERYIW